MILAHEFYLVIHASTQAREQGLACGASWDLPLSEQGMADAKKLAKNFEKQKVGVKVIFSSPLLRCVQMTDIIHDQLKVKVRVVSGLTERNLGSWEKKPLAELPQFSATVDAIPGGENLNRFRARVQESLNFILDNSSVALLVTHELFGQALLGQLGLPDSKLSACVLYRFTRSGVQAPWSHKAVF